MLPHRVGFGAADAGGGKAAGAAPVSRMTAPSTAASSDGDVAPQAAAPSRGDGLGASPEPRALATGAPVPWLEESSCAAPEAAAVGTGPGSPPRWQRGPCLPTPVAVSGDSRPEFIGLAEFVSSSFWTAAASQNAAGWDDCRGGSPLACSDLASNDAGSAAGDLQRRGALSDASLAALQQSLQAQALADAGANAGAAGCLWAQLRERDAQVAELQETLAEVSAGYKAAVAEVAAQRLAAERSSAAIAAATEAVAAVVDAEAETLMAPCRHCPPKLRRGCAGVEVADERSCPCPSAVADFWGPATQDEAEALAEDAGRAWEAFYREVAAQAGGPDPSTSGAAGPLAAAAVRASGGRASEVAALLVRVALEATSAVRASAHGRGEANPWTAHAPTRNDVVDSLPVGGDGGSRAGSPDGTPLMDAVLSADMSNTHPPFATGWEHLGYAVAVGACSRASDLSSASEEVLVELQGDGGGGDWDADFRTKDPEATAPAGLGCLAPPAGAGPCEDHATAQEAGRSPPRAAPAHHGGADASPPSEPSGWERFHGGPPTHVAHEAAIAVRWSPPSMSLGRRIVVRRPRPPAEWRAAESVAQWRAAQIGSRVVAAAFVSWRHMLLPMQEAMGAYGGGARTHPGSASCQTPLRVPPQAAAGRAPRRPANDTTFGL